MVEEAARLAVATPAASHGFGMWFRPMVTRYLKGRGIATLGDLVAYCRYVWAQLYRGERNLNSPA